MRRLVACMYTLTIVLLVSKLVLVSDFATREACEVAAEDARAFKAGAQAVESARCDPKSDQPRAGERAPRPIFKLGRVEAARPR